MSTKKIALLFHGIVGGIGGQDGIGKTIDLNACTALIKHFVIENNNVDIFIHSWSVEHRKTILKMYNPVSFKFEDQEYFGIKHDRRAYPILSRFESLNRVIQLKTEHETKNNFKYDLVMALRFDLVFFAKLNLNSLDPNFIYVPWDYEIPQHKNPCQLHDIYIISSSENINTLSEISIKLQRDIKAAKGPLGKLSPHVILWQHVAKYIGSNKIKYALEHYSETVIYRHVASPELNPLAKKYNMFAMKDKLNKTLKAIGA